MHVLRYTANVMIFLFHTRFAIRWLVITLGCYWRCNSKAWMKTDIMLEWLYWFDQQVTGRKVLLLMDNFSAHVAAVEASRIRPLQNTVICWLPPNATSARGRIKASP